MSDNSDNGMPKATRNLLDRYAPNTQAKPKAETVSDIRPAEYACYSLHPRSQLMIDLRMPDGSQRAIPYHLMDGFAYHRTTGIDLSFSMAKVAVRGRRLRLLYDALLAYRIGYLSVEPRGELLQQAESGEPVITEINYTPIERK